jgi:hypothetical protein
MLKWLKETYHQYREWIRVDMLMYALLILMIVLYGIYKLVF